jgi:hypothetical protein
LYKNIKLEDFISHEKKGMVVRLSYDCPLFKRGQLLKDSGRFQDGMLVSLFQLNCTTKELAVTFLEVSLAQSTFSMEDAEAPTSRATVKLSFLPTTAPEDILQLSQSACGLRPDVQISLVEMPKVLFAGF